MATFPALRPASRTFTAASYPNATHVAYSGRENRVRTSNAQTGARLRLQFLAITETQMLEVASHYAGQRGRFLPFPLSEEVLSGMANPSALTPAGYQWIYVGVPKVTDISVGTAAAPSCVHDVELELEMVPEISAFTGGAAWVASAVLAGGAGDGGEINLPGAAWSAAAAIAGGAASIPDASVDGAAWSAAAAIAGGEASTVTSSNPNFSDVALLLHMDGTAGSTVFTDSSAAARTVTTYGDAKISTTQSMFGGASGLFDGSGDYLRIADATAFNLSAGGTIEAWVYMTNAAGGIIAYKGTYGSNESWVFSVTSTTLRIGTNQSNSSLANSGLTIPINQWHHVAMSYNPSTGTKLFLNGAVVASSALAITNASADITIGIGTWNYPVFGPFYGYIDDLRITKAAIYSAAFTPPTAAFPNS